MGGYRIQRHASLRYVTLRYINFCVSAGNATATLPPVLPSPAITRYPFFVRLPFGFAFCCHFNIGAGVFLLAAPAVTITRENSYKKSDNNDNGAKREKLAKTGENGAQRKVHSAGANQA